MKLDDTHPIGIFVDSKEVALVPGFDDGVGFEVVTLEFGGKDVVQKDWVVGVTSIGFQLASQGVLNSLKMLVKTR